MQLTPPTNKKEVRTYCGFVQCLGKYCYGLKDALQPISELNKKRNRFHWSDEHQTAFNHVQQIINNADILAHPDWKKEYYIWTDASDKAYGACLMQKDENGEFQPVEFMSKLWTDAQKYWHITTKEIYSVIAAIKKWNRFLYKSSRKAC